MNDEQLRMLVSRADIVRRKSAMQPALWLNAIVLPTFIGAGAMAGYSTTVGVVFVGAAIATILVTLALYVYFAVMDPDRLRAQEWRRNS